jgi:UDP-N-acetylmuramate: L-alanyl-gamma-D-glutamyl-meso-diaminopimelate ligase
MSDVLRDEGIDIMAGFDVAHLDPRPDVVIVGNAVPAANVEARAAESLGIERMSFPQAVAEYFIGDCESLVVSGTHGKTTTTGMLARVLDDAGQGPGYLVGGLVRDLGEFARAATGPYFVIEGDEYDSAYFDKRPKFVHYRPHAAILTSVEFDHADIYADLDAVRAAFADLAARIPSDGFLVGCADYRDVMEIVAPKVRGRFISYGSSRTAAQPCDWHLGGLQASAVGQTFDACYRGAVEARLTLSVPGRMNALNALAVFALCRELGIDEAAVTTGLAHFEGAARRQEKVGEEAGVVVIDDFAHHPTAVQATLEAIRERYAGHRIVAVFEPRSNTSRRRIFQDQFTRALALADVVVLSAVYRKENDPLTAENMLSTDTIVRDLAARGRTAWCGDGPDEILARLPGDLRSGDVVVCMSNGAFGSLPRRLVSELGGGSGAELPIQP